MSAGKWNGRMGSADCYALSVIGIRSSASQPGLPLLTRGRAATMAPMLDVVSLQYGTAFKKAFGDPVVFSAFVHDALGIEFHTDHVEQEHAFQPVYGRVDIRYDLFAEDTARRIIVELQHVRDDESFDRFLYYHLIGQCEQIQGADEYRFRRTVYTLVVLTRWPKDPALRFDVAYQNSDLQRLDGQPLNVYGHRLVFVNARGAGPETPAPLRRWLELIEDSLDQRVDETKYPEEALQRALRTVERTRISPQEAFRLKDEASWEIAKREARDEGEAEGLRTAVLALCKVFGVVSTAAQHAQLEGAGTEELRALLQRLEQTRKWLE